MYCICIVFFSWCFTATVAERYTQPLVRLSAGVWFPITWWAFLFIWIFFWKYHTRYHTRYLRFVCDIIPDIRPDILSDISYNFFPAGLCVSGRPIPFSGRALGWIQCHPWFRYNWCWRDLVCKATTLLQVHTVSHWCNGEYTKAQGIFIDILQHLWTHQPDARQLYAAEGRSHVVWAVSYSVAFPLCLPCGERTWACATDPVLLEWEHQQYHPIQVQRRYTSGGDGGFKTR